MSGHNPRPGSPDDGLPWTTLLLGLVAVVVLVLVVSATVGTGIPVIDGATDAVLGSEEFSADRSELRRAIHAEINEIRERRGLAPLALSPELNEVARYHSQQMLDREFYDHVRPDGQTPADRLQRFGVECERVGENIYKGTTNPENEREYAEAVVQAWMDSPGHRRNILREGWSREGLGVAIGTYDGDQTVFVTQNFC